MSDDRRSFHRWLALCLGVLLALPGMLEAQFAGAPAPPATAPADAAGSKLVQQVEFRELPLEDALRLVSRQTNLNLVASQAAGKTKVSLFLQNVPSKAVVEELCRANNLWYRQDDKSGIIRIMQVSEFQRDLTSFREEQTQVFSVLYPNAVSIASAIADLYGDRVRLSLGDDEITEESRDLSERLTRFDMVDQRSQSTNLFGNNGTAGGTTTTVTPYGTTVGSNNSGGYTSSTTARQLASSGTAAQSTGPGDTYRPLTPGQAEAVTQAMKDAQSPTEREALLESLQRKPANIYVRVIRRNNLIAVRTGDQAILQEISKLVRRLDVPTPTVLLEVKVLSVTLSDDFNSVFDYQFSNGSGLAGGFTTGEVQPPAGDLLSGSARKFAAMIPGGTGVQQQDLIFQFVSDSFRLRMQLLEDKNRVTELAAPLLLTANNEVSRLFVGENYPIVQNISTQVVQNQTSNVVAPNTTIQFQPVGTTLLITPSINADRTVTLRLLQQNSQIITAGANIPVVNSSGGITQQPVDVVSARTLSGTIVAKDGLMLAVGGLIEENVTDKRAEVPVLGKLPGLGFFFRRQQTSRSRNELIIMIRPHVLSTPAESEGISKDLLSNLSIHPNASDPSGTMKTFDASEPVRPNLPTSKEDAIFRFHSVSPADY